MSEAEGSLGGLSSVTAHSCVAKPAFFQKMMPRSRVRKMGADGASPVSVAPSTTCRR